jgi:outer membrane protein OmpA-like peptidoglycan-associated protein
MRGTYYYEDSKGKLQPMKVGGETVYALPTPSQARELAMTDPMAPAKVKLDITDGTVIKPNLTYVFHFDSDKTELAKEAIPELEKLYEYLRKNSGYGIRISGFADANGTRERNQQISEERAKQVAHYITNKGIVAKRILAKGYGQAPEALKATTEDEKRNFRIAEITVVELAKLK